MLPTGLPNLYGLSPHLFYYFADPFGQAATTQVTNVRPRPDVLPFTRSKPVSRLGCAEGYYCVGVETCCKTGTIACGEGKF
jgi:hypothetical protein